MEVEPGVYDFRLENDSSMVVSGPSKSGKSTFVTNLLKHRNVLFRRPVRNMWWFYGVPSPFHKTLREMGVQLHEGVPTRSEFDQVGPGDIVVLDDLQQEMKGNEEITNLFLKECHHQGFFAIQLTQYLYGDKEQRMRMKNAHYYVLFDNPRNQQQIVHFLSRMLPKGNVNVIYKILQDIRRNSKYGYLFVDFTPECDPNLRLRSNIFNDMVVFKLQPGQHGSKMDYSRMTLGGSSVGGGSTAEKILKKQDENEQVKHLVHPDQSYIEDVARRIVRRGPSMTSAQVQKRNRQLIAFNNLRRLYMGLEERPPPRPPRIPTRHAPPIPWKRVKYVRGVDAQKETPPIPPRKMTSAKTRAFTKTAPHHNFHSLQICQI